MDLRRLLAVDMRDPLGRDLARAASIADLRVRAKRRLPRIVFDFVEGGAGAERTTTGNMAAFESIGLEPAYLRDVSARDISATIFGDRVTSPVILGPTGMQRLAHPEGELAVARAAGQMGVIYVAAIASGYTIEEIAAVATGPLWFQLYLWRSREVVRTMVERAYRVGCRVLCLTVDLPVVGLRERDLRNGVRMPPRLNLTSALDAARRPRWLAGIVAGQELTYANLRDVPEAAASGLPLMEFLDTKLINPAATWDELEWLRGQWDRPIVVKGITSEADARAAVERGADGVVVSNHGGRQLDDAPVTISRLPRIIDAVGDRARVFVDGGVRRGGDVVKALALGAAGCLVARPYWYGLGAGGEDGVRRCLEILNSDLDRTLALLGRPTVGELDASLLRNVEIA